MEQVSNSNVVRRTGGMGVGRPYGMWDYLGVGEVLTITLMIWDLSDLSNWLYAVPEMRGYRIVWWLQELLARVEDKRAIELIVGICPNLLDISYVRWVVKFPVVCLICDERTDNYKKLLGAHLRRNHWDARGDDVERILMMIEDGATERMVEGGNDDDDRDVVDYMFEIINGDFLRAGIDMDEVD